MKTVSTAFWIMAVVIFAAFSAAAAPVKVTLDKVTGGVEYKADDSGAWKAAKSGDSIPVGATVKTKGDGTCMIKWAKGNAVKIAPLTVIKVSEADSTGGIEKSSLNLQEGKAFAHAKKITSAGSSFEIKTPTAVAGVRGTDLYGTVSGGQSSFGVAEGTIAVEAGGAEVVVEVGLSVMIDETGSISEPMPIPEEIREEVNQNAAEVREEAKNDETKEEMKEEKKEEKAEEKAEKAEEKEASHEEESAEEAEADTDVDIEDSDASNSIDQALENDLTNEIIDTAEKNYITGDVEVEIYLPSSNQ